jgi:hypothetical protein
MDSYRDHPSDFDAVPSSGSDAAPASDVTAAIGTDERRMHVRAYNYWVSLLEGRDFPSIEDLESDDVQDFSAHSVLLDFTCGRDNPSIPYVGALIRDECGLDDDTRTIAEVPNRSLLSRLTDHYMQIIANRAPVGFEAEFENPRGETICYRGILMPFSSNGEEIDFIYGVINWKRVDARAAAATLVAALGSESEPQAPDAVEIAGHADVEATVEPIFEEEPLELVERATEAEPLELIEQANDEEPLELTDGAIEEDPLELTEVVATAAEEPAIEIADFGGSVEVAIHPSWEDGPLHDEHEIAMPEIALDETAGLADRLWAARETAESVKAGEGRTRSALYKALSLAYDFAVAAQASPEEYAELLDESGVKAQARAPMTPIVKLVFGIDYDKARLTEFAAALSFAQRQDVPAGSFQEFIEKQPGGLKALVAAERQARRPEPKVDTKGDVARARLRSAPSISLAEVPSADEFAVVITRRGADGIHEPVAVVEDQALLERAIRRVA